MRTNSVLTPCKQGAVLSRYSNFTHPNMAFLNHADGEALALQFLDSLTDGFVVLGGYA